MDLTEAETLRKDFKSTQHNCLSVYLSIYLCKDINDLGNHDGMITHLELDILEFEFKWTLGSNTMIKASGVYEILAEPFQILKYDAIKVLHQYACKFGKFSSGHRTGKSQFLLQFQRNAMTKNVQTTAQLHSSHMLTK